MYKNRLIIGSLLFIVILFSGCGGPRYTYKLSTNVLNTKVYCGYNKTNLNYCYTAPYYKRTNISQGWSNKYFQGRKDGYKNTPIVKHPPTTSYASVRFYMKKETNFNDYKVTKSSTLELIGTEELLSYQRKGANGQQETLTPNNDRMFIKVSATTTDNHYDRYYEVHLLNQSNQIIKPFSSKSSYKAKDKQTNFSWIFNISQNDKNFKLITKNNYVLDITVETLQEKVNILITNQDIEGLKKLINKNSAALEYIPNIKLKLALMGPDNLKVNDITKLIKKGMSEVLIIAQIKRVKTPYSEFNINEIEVLQQMGLSDNIIAEMINITTKINDKNRDKEEQNRYLAEQQRISKSNNKKPRVIYRQAKTNNNSKKQESNPLLEKATDKLLEAGAKKLFDHFF